MEVKDDNRCFVCGSDNERGLKLSFTVEDGEAYTEFTPPFYFQGYAGILHGGIVSTLLDEVMVKATKRKVVTVELAVKFIKPVPIGEKVVFYGKVDKVVKKMVFASSEAKDNRGNTLATANGKYFCLDY